MVGSLLFVFCLPVFSLAFTVPTISGYVVDEADIFSSEEEAQITDHIQKIQQKTSAEIAILTVPTLHGEDIFEAGMQVVEAWKIGKKDTDNGLLLLISVNDREWQFFTGYGLEGALPDALITRIGDRNFPDAFRSRDYARGVLSSLSDIEGIIEQDPSIVSEYQNNNVEVFALIGPLLGMGFVLGSLLSGIFGRRKTLASFSAAGMLQVIGLSMANDAGVAIFWGSLVALPALLLAMLIIHSSSNTSSNFWTSGGFGGGSSFGRGGSSGFSGFGGGSFGGGGGRGRW